MKRPRKASGKKFARKQGTRLRVTRPRSSAVSHSLRLASADRKSLLLGTALASTLLIGSMLAPAPAHALTDCLTLAPPPPGPILVPLAPPPNLNDAITCTNTVARENNAGNVIDLRTQGNDHYIYLDNSGALTASDNDNDASAIGIYTGTDGDNSHIDIINSGGIGATATGTSDAYAAGIGVLTQEATSPVYILNTGDVTATATAESPQAYGFRIRTFRTESPIDIVNSGDIQATAIGTDFDTYAFGMYVRSDLDYSVVHIVNSGNITATANGDLFVGAYGVYARTRNEYSHIDIFNSGDINATATGGFSFAAGIRALGEDRDISIKVENHGDIIVTADDFTAFGIAASAIFIFTENNPIDIINSGTIRVTSVEAETAGIAARVDGPGSPIGIVNSGDIIVTTAGDAYGIRARNYGDGNLVDIDNSGGITVTTTGNSNSTIGIFAQSGVSFSSVANNRIDIDNRGHLRVTASGSNGGAAGIAAINFDSVTPVHVENRGNIDVSTSGNNAATFGIIVNDPVDFATEPGSPVTIINHADITVTASGNSPSTFGIFPQAGGIAALTGGDDNAVRIENHGDIVVAAPNAGNSTGILAATSGANSPVDVINSGSVQGEYFGILAFSNTGTTIINSGFVSAQSLLAIQVGGAGNAAIYNSGVIFGYVLLDADDKMIIEPGGTFEARLTSDFDATGPGGDDLFQNDGAVHALRFGTQQPFFVNLERFENRGVISTQDGNVGDVFRIANTLGGPGPNDPPPPGPVLAFAASGNSALAIDAFLGGPGSTADNFIIDGDVTGQTRVIVNSTKATGGTFNPEGIPIVFVNGNVNANAFYLPQPFDSGLFDWDVYFVETGSGFFELRSFPGQGAHVLPQLLTAAQDVFHTTNETWFDRTADLRVLLNGGVPYGTGGGGLGQGGISTAFTPAVWFKGSGTWLDQEDRGTTRAYGQTYRYNLDRELNVANFEGGIDFGKKGIWAEGDALVFGLLGGAILGSLDYDKVNRRFDIEGGEVGGYLTYLSGGLFLDTLVKVDFLEFDTNDAPGLPGSLDATAFGFRTDAGYRFGGFGRGPFIEPLATIAVAWSEIDDFALGGNSVKFDDEADVRGRLGLRVGTSREVWPSIVMEPFVIGSVWGHLSGENSATVTSLGTKFGPFTDEPGDVWGVVSTGVNFFSPGANTSLFGKVDVTFGDDIDGIAARGGLRHNW